MQRWRSSGILREIWKGKGCTYAVVSLSTGLSVHSSSSCLTVHSASINKGFTQHKKNGCSGCNSQSNHTAARFCALRLIDASQGVQAQTVANVHLAMNQNLAIILVINKIDLPAADIDMCHEQLEEILQIPAEEAVAASAKEGIGIEEILEAVIKQVPPPTVPDDDYTRALIFDSLYDTYRGVVKITFVLSAVPSSAARLFATSATMLCPKSKRSVYLPRLCRFVMSSRSVRWGISFPIPRLLKMQRSVIPFRRVTDR